MKRDGDEWIVVDVRKDAQGNTVVTLRPATARLPSSALLLLRTR